MITSDGRSGIEAEMEAMHFSMTDIGEKPMELDYRDHTLPDGYSTIFDTPLARISRWFSRIFSPLQA
jgi:hypothetical protein